MLLAYRELEEKPVVGHQMVPSKIYIINLLINSYCLVIKL